MCFDLIWTENCVRLIWDDVSIYSQQMFISMLVIFAQTFTSARSFPSIDQKLRPLKWWFSLNKQTSIRNAFDSFDWYFFFILVIFIR